MVPIGDILNHVAKNNAHLRFEETELLICSTKDIKRVRRFILKKLLSCINFIKYDVAGRRGLQHVRRAFQF
jgi:hypothetical protein